MMVNYEPNCLLIRHNVMLIDCVIICTRRRTLSLNSLLFFLFAKTKTTTQRLIRRFAASLSPPFLSEVIKFANSPKIWRRKKNIVIIKENEIESINKTESRNILMTSLWRTEGWASVVMGLLENHEARCPSVAKHQLKANCARNEAAARKKLFALPSANPSLRSAIIIWHFCLPSLTPSMLLCWDCVNINKALHNY